MKIAVTGHRPNKMPKEYGYDIYNFYWTGLKNILKNILIAHVCDEAYCGMAIGVDMAFAMAVLELKDDGYDIKLHCAIPCRSQSRMWPKETVDIYNDILDRADIITLVSDEEYKPYLMQKRNEYMVDNVDEVIAVWDGTSGGTGNCVRYAKKCGKDIVRIFPYSLLIKDE